MKILAVDTSASPVSVALTDNSRLVGELYLNIKTTHSQTLMPLIESILKTTNTNINDIDIFAVNAGPGSFTGVRIGVASIKGLSMPLNKPCASVSTLESMAYCMPYKNGIVCAVMDARCSQVYNAIFRLNDSIPERLTPDRALSIDELSAELKTYSENIYLVGDGAEICSKAFSDIPNISLTPENIRFQHAYGTAIAAQKMAEQNALCTSDSLMPIYLRLPQAERELKAKQQKIIKGDN